MKQMFTDVDEVRNIVEQVRTKFLADLDVTKYLANLKFQNPAKDHIKTLDSQIPAKRGM